MSCATRQSALRIGDHTQYVVNGGSHQLRRGRRSGRADVRDQVADRYVNLVAYRADNRNAAGMNRPGYHLLVKRPQVFE